MSVRRVGVEGTGHSVMSIPKLFPYRWKYMIQCGSVVTRFIFFKILTADIGWIAQEGEPWGTYCDFEVWPVFYIDNFAAAGIILYMRSANERRRYSVTPSLIGFGAYAEWFVVLYLILC